MLNLEVSFSGLRYWTDRPDPTLVLDKRDAELDREDSLSKRYGFQIGEDLGVFRFDPPQQWACDEMERGYAHGLTRRARHADVYVRKLLALRRNAYSRGIPVSSALTVEFLRRITVTVCPVSGVALTQGAMRDTDWSIDRLENSLGYVPGNVCFLSLRVNRLKGAAELDHIVEEAKSALSKAGPAALVSIMRNGLTVVEALRLVALMSAPSSFLQGRAGRSAPFAMAPLVWATPEAAVAGLHVESARSRIEGSAYARRAALFKRGERALWWASNRLVAHVREQFGRGAHPADIWYDGAALTLLQDLTEVTLRNPPEWAEATEARAAAMLASINASLPRFKRL
jgi:hypothetical protein